MCPPFCTKLLKHSKNEDIFEAKKSQFNAWTQKHVIRLTNKKQNIKKASAASSKYVKIVKVLPLYKLTAAYSTACQQLFRDERVSWTIEIAGTEKRTNIVY